MNAQRLASDIVEMGRRSLFGGMSADEIVECQIDIENHIRSYLFNVDEQRKQAEAERDHWRDYAQELKRDILVACVELLKVRDELANTQVFCGILERRLTEAGK